MVRKIKRISVNRKITVLTAKGKNEWKDLAKRGIIKNLSVRRINNKDFGLHWKIKYTGVKNILVKK